MKPRTRHLVLVLGDQLDAGAAAFDDFDAREDAVWMAEVAGEAEHVWSGKPRIALFLAAMRHFAQALREAGLRLHYRRLDDPANAGTLAAELAGALRELQPQRVVMTAPGDWRVWQDIRGVVQAAGIAFEVREDRHFYCTVRDFAAFARGRTQMRLEHFYRLQRKRHDVLMRDGQPEGGRWNLDAENRASFGREGPGMVPAPARVAPDAITREVLALVQTRFAAHPGSLADFAWPVTRAQALEALHVFVEQRLPMFGPY